MLFFNIQARLKVGGRRMYVPPEGKLIRDIESSWMLLEKAEHDRELALREELVRFVAFNSPTWWHKNRPLGVVASVVRRMNEVTVHWARLVLGWMTVWVGIPSRCVTSQLG